MSSTRKAKDDSVFRQERYASSDDFERGLKATSVAKKCSIISDRSERELLWFLQYQSHLDGGLESIADDLMIKCSDRIQSEEMAAIGMASGKILTADEVKQIRRKLPAQRRERFPLKGEGKICGYSANTSNEDLEYLTGGRVSAPECDRLRDCFNSLPDGYPAGDFVLLCLEEAESELGKYLLEFCLDPSIKPRQGPWYFSGLFNALCEYKARWEKDKSNAVVTALGAIIVDALTFALKKRSMVLIEGNARMGKSFSARTWCEQNPGKARFLEVPPFNDDAGFFRAVARALGLGNFLNYKAHEIRDRVEAVLRDCDLLLVLDEAQRLWPQNNLRRGHPARIDWIMTMANAGVPIVLISTPQFIGSQKAMEKAGWNSAQLTGRIGRYEFLPTQLSHEDLMAVAHAVLPEASEKLLKGIASYARLSSRYLAAVETIAKSARYIAEKNNREQCTDADITSAMKLSVIPSDTMLTQALAQADPSKRRGRPSGVIVPSEPMAEADDDSQAMRDIAPAKPLQSGKRSIVPANELTEV